MTNTDLNSQGESPILHNYTVEMRNIIKRFGTTIANERVNLKISPGEILALVGENGAGKSTLMNILYGLLQPDEGEILINSRKVACTSPSHAISHGIGMVHQHFMLIPPFTVTENIILGSEPHALKLFINDTQARQSVIEVCKTYGFKLEPDMKIESLNVGVEQRVEIIKMLYRHASILILDEPTAVLTPQETDELFVILRKFKNEGKAIIFISHKLGEVLKISDRITVMKSGKNVGELITSKTNREEIARLMVGRDVLLSVNKNLAKPGKPVLEIKNVEAKKKNKLLALRNINLSVHSGEIVGIAGVEGNGQTELIEVITGLMQPTGGDILLNDISICGKTTREIFEKGLSHIPEDRLKRGLINEFTVRENLILGKHRSPLFNRMIFHNQNRILEDACKLIQEFDIRPSVESYQARQLSGGNQQKIILARELSRNPVCLIAAQPTRGVDIGAIEFIHQRILEARDKGVAVLLISADLSEIMSLSDRIAVLYEGAVMGIVNADKTNEKELGLMMTGKKME